MSDKGVSRKALLELISFEANRDGGDFERWTILAGKIISGDLDLTESEGEAADHEKWLLKRSGESIGQLQAENEHLRAFLQNLRYKVKNGHTWSHNDIDEALKGSTSEKAVQSEAKREVCWNCRDEEKTVTAEGMCYDCRIAWRY